MEVGEEDSTVDHGKRIFGPPSFAELQKFISVNKTVKIAMISLNILLVQKVLRERVLRTDIGPKLSFFYSIVNKRFISKQILIGYD